jgi:transposase
LLIIGGNSILRWKRKVDANPWLSSLKGRKPHLVVAVALANKMARIVWAILKKQTIYQAEYGKAA